MWRSALAIHGCAAVVTRAESARRNSCVHGRAIVSALPHGNCRTKKRVASSVIVNPMPQSVKIADEQKPAKEGSVEAWGRSATNPVGGWYGERKGLRGRFGVYIPPLMEALGLAEVTHDAKANRMRAT